MGKVTLEFLAKYVEKEPYKEDFAKAISQKTHLYLCSFGQTILKQNKDDKIGYLLFFIGSTFANFYCPQNESNVVNLVKKYLFNFNKTTDSGDKEKMQIIDRDDLQLHSAILKQVLLFIYTRSYSADDNTCLLFIEIFRSALLKLTA